MKKDWHTLTLSVVLSASFLCGCAKTADLAGTADPRSPEEIAGTYSGGGNGFVITDLNGDGTKELLIGTIGNGVFQSFITQMYALNGNGNIALFSGNENERLYLLNRGELLKEGSSSDFDSYWTIHHYEDNALHFKEGIIYDETLSSDYPWFAADSTGKAGESISSEEFLNIVNDYESRIQNPFLIAFSRALNDTFALNGKSAKKIILSIQHLSTKDTEISDPSVIEQFMNAFSQVTIGNENDDGTTDSDDVITCFFDDGSTANIRFRRGKLAYGPKDECYELNGADSLFTLYEKYSGSSVR